MKHMQNAIAEWLGAEAWDHTKQGFVEVFEKPVHRTSWEPELPKNEAYGNKYIICMIDRADTGEFDISGS